MAVRRASLLREYRRRGYLSDTQAAVATAYAIDQHLAGDDSTVSQPDLMNQCRHMGGQRAQRLLAKERIAGAHKILPAATEALLIAVVRSDCPPGAWMRTHGANPSDGLPLLREALTEIAPLYLEACPRERGST